jgi:hypothetical protein
MKNTSTPETDHTDDNSSTSKYKPVYKKKMLNINTSYNTNY